MAPDTHPAPRRQRSVGPARVRPTALTPSEHARLDLLPPWAAYLVAVVAPVVVAGALTSVRDSLAASAALVLILVVIVIARLAGPGPAVVAALSSGVAFAALLTEPYNRFAIADSSDIIATGILLVVGLVVGVTAQREHRLADRAEQRLDELEHLLAFARLSATDADVDELTSAAERHLVALLHLDRCSWSSAPRASRLPQVLDDGQIMGYLSDLPPDRSELPESGADLVAQTSSSELGHFELFPVPGSVTSVEQRRIAAAITDLYAQAVERSGRGPVAAARPSGRD